MIKQHNIDRLPGLRSQILRITARLYPLDRRVMHIPAGSRSSLRLAVRETENLDTVLQ